MSASRPHRPPVRLGLVVLAVLAVLAVLLPGLSACGSGGTSSTDRACAAKDDLSASIRTVVDDVKAGNLGDARDDLREVRSRASDLASAVADLGAEERKRLQPQVDQVRAQLQDLEDATSLAEVSAGVSAVASSASTLVSAFGDDLSCD